MVVATEFATLVGTDFADDDVHEFVVRDEGVECGRRVRLVLHEVYRGVASVFIGVEDGVTMTFWSGREGTKNITSDNLAFAAALCGVGASSWDAATNVVIEKAVGTLTLSIVWWGFR